MTYRIVVGVDGSEHGNAALRWAVEEAKIHEGEIIAVFAWQMPFIGIPGAFDRDEIEKLSKTFLDEAVSLVVHAEPVPITKFVAQGDVSASLIEAAKDADLLVLGSRGRGGFAGLKLGSVSQECVQHAACPVVVIKQPGDV
jgi:nucleotide-binding universal stress UspA family protein